MSGLPPYATGARIVAGQLWIRYGRPGWEFLRTHRECGELVCPDDEDSAEFDWGAKDLDVYVIVDLAAPHDRALELVDRLLGQGAKTVTVVYRLKSEWPHGGDTVQVTYDGTHGRCG